MKAIAYAMIVTALLATGCARMRSSDPSASPATGTTDKVACEQSGGKWNAFTRNCDR